MYKKNVKILHSRLQNTNIYSKYTNYTIYKFLNDINRRKYFMLPFLPTKH